MKRILFFAIAFILVQVSFAQAIDRSKKPKPGPAPTITIANPVVYKLPNGLTVLVVENHKLPTVRANFRIDQGQVTEGTKTGLLTIMGGMLNEGTTTKPKAQFDEAVDILGANVNLSSGGGYVSSLTRYFPQAFALMSDALRNPSFPKESFDKLISQELTGLKTIEKSASSIADRVVNALAYGVNHPAGEFETETSVKSLTLDDVKAAYKKYITPARAYLTFVGDIKPADAKALAEKSFGNWKGFPLALETVAQVPNPAKTEVDLIDVPNAVQSEINVINLVNIPMSSPDYFPVIVANKILGGGADARLFMNLREKYGFTYGAYSNIGTGRFQADFNASASVRNEKVDSAVGQFLYEINRMRNEKVTATELQNAKNQYNGSFALGMENPARTADFASNILINKLPVDFYRTYLQKINAVTVDDIQRVAKKYFNYDNTRVVVVGKQEAVLPNLKASGYTVKLYDKYAAPVTESTMKKADISAAQVIDKYILAIGGKENLDKVNTIAITGKLGIMGQSLPMTAKQMAPNKELFVISMAGNPVMKQVYDGTTGYQSQMGQKQDMSPDELTQKKDTKSLFEQLNYKDADYKLEVKGIEKVADGDAYVVVVTFPSGRIRTEYYNVNSGLLVKSIEEKKGEGGETVDYADYRKTGDVMLPYKITRNVNTPAGSQELAMTMETIKINEGVTAEDFK
jgi:zinc protease